MHSTTPTRTIKDAYSLLNQVLWPSTMRHIMYMVAGGSWLARSRYCYKQLTLGVILGFHSLPEEVLINKA